MSCIVNSILKLKSSQGYPKILELGTLHQTIKDGYRIFPMDVPIQLVDDDWVAHADVVITHLLWNAGQTTLTFQIQRIYDVPFGVKA